MVVAGAVLALVVVVPVLAVGLSANGKAWGGPGSQSIDTSVPLESAVADATRTRIVEATGSAAALGAR